MEESGLHLEHPAAATFRQHVLAGDWVGRVLDALHVLRNELTPLQHDTPRVHRLSALMMCGDAEELRGRAQWSGGPGSRAAVLARVQAVLPPALMMAPARLRALLAQAAAYQAQRCRFHSAPRPEPDPDRLPFSLLADHQFSMSTAMRCGTASGPRMAQSWHLAPRTTRHWTATHTAFRICRGAPTMSQSQEDSLTAAAWQAGSERFVCGGARGQFYQCSLDGALLNNWDGVRVNALAARADGTVLAADTHHRHSRGTCRDGHDAQLLGHHAAAQRGQSGRASLGYPGPRFGAPVPWSVAGTLHDTRLLRWRSRRLHRVGQRRQQGVHLAA
ncbi:unnamed protein product [Leptidea sinapis]|uniref:CTLH domain-containing protein n=1 Tax=Leptidea sinapis TaxID=189913 RepID=A0A5E4Q8N0_9NEOP|nr:unnamed protein product [Leptidea sinapis]